MSTWMPDAIRIPAWRNAGPMVDARRVLWIAPGLDDGYSAHLAARYCNATIRSATLIWDPRTGDVVQMLPADKRATWIRSDALQVLVLQQGNEPESLAGLPSVMGWLRSLGVPDSIPAGPAVPTMPIDAGDAPGHYSSGGKIDVHRFLRS